MALATRMFIIAVLSLDEFFNNIPIDQKPITHDPGIPLNILIAFTSIVMAPIIEEIIFRKWILGSFLNLGKYIYIGLVASCVLFIHPDSRVFASLVSGLMPGLIYLRFGLKGSIFFHVIYNLLWFIVRNNRSVYDNLFTWLDFGFLYWFVFLISIVLVVVFILRSIKSINSKYTNAESGI
ncbi:MAG TPA: CPBP family intramembrane glutamic endopeptidase [Saprospiraceae bacterium]|nr:CPBP family intramembrane glutamic endopeptidase [Saprospiraceae bacterium]